MFNKIMYTTLLVTDQDKALDFYTEMFGFEKRAGYNLARLVCTTLVTHVSSVIDAPIV